MPADSPLPETSSPARTFAINGFKQKLRPRQVAAFLRSRHFRKGLCIGQDTPQNSSTESKTDWPTWSSNSQFIYFLRGYGMISHVYRVRVSDGVEERVVDLKGFHPTGALTGWMGLDREQHTDIDW